MFCGNFQEKFMYLLETIKFSVAQDQDYLNRLCKGRVKIIENTWNRMPIGMDTIRRENLNLIHYNLAFKPWHFEDILYKEEKNLKDQLSEKQKKLQKAQKNIEQLKFAIVMYLCAMFAKIFTDLYKSASAINLGNGYIFGPIECARGARFPIPSIVEINMDVLGIDTLRGKTVFGRNDLFWFAFDAFGTFYMLDNLTLRVLRKYDDPYRAMSDCLVAGKF